MAITILATFLALVIFGIPIAASMIIVGLTFIVFQGKSATLIVPFARFMTAFEFSMLGLFLFVTLGVVLIYTEIASVIVEFVSNLLGRKVRGSLGVITILGCAACGPLTGSTVGTTSAVGTTLYPQMKARGYDSAYATVLFSYAGILGSMIPPSITGLIYAITVELPVLSVWVATGGIGLVYTLILLIVNSIISRRFELTDAYVAMESNNLASSFVKALPAALIPLGVLGSILGGVATPTEAGAIGVLTTLVLGLFYYKTLTSVSQLTDALYEAGRLTAVIVFLLCASYSLSHVLTITGAMREITRVIFLVTTNKNILLLLVSLTVLVFGCFIDDVPIILLLAPMAHTILEPLGVHPLHIASLFTFLCLVGHVTPPVGSVLYTALAITREPIGRVVRYIAVFFVPVVLLSVAVVFIPEIALYLPRLMGLL